MHRNPAGNRPEPRHDAERDAAQPIAGQPRTDDADDELQEPETVPSFLNARELQARDPAKGASRVGGPPHAESAQGKKKPAGG